MSISYQSNFMKIFNYLVLQFAINLKLYSFYALQKIKDYKITELTFFEHYEYKASKVKL